MKLRGIVDQYEVKNKNTEVVMYWRQMTPNEVKNVELSLIHRYAGECLQKPHTAYMYYNND